MDEMRCNGVRNLNYFIVYNRFHEKTIEEKLINLNHTLYVISVFKVPGINIRGVERIGTANPLYS